MKKITSFLFTVAFAFSLLFAGPTGCNATLDKAGVYEGDKTLYAADKSITTSYKLFDEFLKFELQFRDKLPVSVSRAADNIRLNAKKWIASAIALRDAYAANPTTENRSKLNAALSVIDAAIAESTKYMAANKNLK